MALSGGAAILARTSGKTVIVNRVPVAGGAATKLLSAPGQVLEVAASEQRVAVLLSTKAGYRVYAGPATGPLTLVPAKNPYGIDVAGDTVMVLGDAIVAVAPDGSRRTLDFPERAAAFEFGGDFVAFTERKADEAEDSPTGELRERNWRTGETVRSLDLGEATGVIDTDVRDDGGLLLELDDGRMHTLLPGEELKDLGKDPSLDGQARHRWAGGSYTVPVGNGTFATPSLAGRAFGLPSAQVQDLYSDGTTAVWQADGCALTADLDDPVSHRIAAGACRLSEAVVVPPYAKPRGRRVKVRLRCLVATGTRCRGIVRAPELRRAVRVSIPAGEARTLRLPLRRKAKEVVHVRIALRGGRVREDLYPLR